MSGIPAERAVGGLQVLRYEKGQAFDAHYDYYDKEFLEDHPLTRQRMATAIMYLCVHPVILCIHCISKPRHVVLQ